MGINRFWSHSTNEKTPFAVDDSRDITQNGNKASESSGSLLLDESKDHCQNASSERTYDEAVAMVKLVLDKMGVHYISGQPTAEFTLFEMGMGVKSCNLRVRVVIEREPLVCRLDAILPINADALYAYLLCEKIVEMNFPKRYGALQYDKKDGEVSYRYSFPISHGLHEDTFEIILLTIATSAAGEYEVIRKMCVGKLNASEIEAVCERLESLLSDLRS